jgi:hypothetical protein
MATDRPPSDRDEAPMHHEIQERFARLHVAVAAIAGLVAVVAGILFGVFLAND